MKLNLMAWIVGALVVGSSVAFAQDAYEGNPHNGLSSGAFRLNALTSNRDALEVLSTHALDDGLFSVQEGYIAQQLRDPGAAAVMADLVACALDDKTTIKYRDPGNQEHAWHGELGLCPSWHDGPPSRDCQEIVTACLAARVNALDRSIPLSLRSESSAVSAPRVEVHADTRYRESPRNEDPSQGWPIDSFAHSQIACVPGQECNWESAYVGMCDPRDPAPIQLAIASASTCGAVTLRVCAGIHGCNALSHPTWPDGSPRPSSFEYSGHVADQNGACRNHPLAFRCPNGTVTSGFYSVMAVPNSKPAPNKPPPALRVVKVAGSGSYPILEKKVFSFVEGAFYGNLFDPDMLRRSCQVSRDGTTLDCTAGRMAGDHAADETCGIGLTARDPRVANGTAGAGGRVSSDGGENACLRQDPSIPYAKVYACYSYGDNSNDSASVAALNSRICDLPGAAQCFPNPVQRCRFDTPAAGSGPGCDVMAPDGGYRSCPGQGNDHATYKNVLTTYLNEPCDLIGNPELCNQLRAGRSTVVQPKSSRPPHFRGCAGCSTGAGGGAAAAAVLAGLVALIVLRRRRAA